MEPMNQIVHVNETISFSKQKLEALNDIENGHVSSYPVVIDSQCGIYFYLAIFPCNFTKLPDNTFLAIRGSVMENDFELNAKIETNDATQRITKGKLLDLGKTSNFYKLFNNDEISIKIYGFCAVTMPFVPRVPVSIQWKVNEAILKARGSISSKRYALSYNTTTKYYFSVTTINQNACICLHYDLANGDKLRTLLTFSIDSASYSKDMCVTFATDLGHGITICSTSDLFNHDNYYFVDGEMIINVHGSVFMENKEHPSPRIALTTRNTVVTTELDNRGIKDFRINVENKNIRVHQSVLSDSSSVFEALFKSNMIETRERKMKIIDFTYETVRTAVNILYNKIPTSLTIHEAFPVLQFSDKYDIAILKDIVVKHLINKLTQTNVCTILNHALSGTLSAPKLVEGCKSFIVKCSKESEYIPDLNTLDHDLLHQILMSNFVTNIDSQ